MLFGKMRDAPTPGRGYGIFRRIFTWGRGEVNVTADWKDGLSVTHSNRDVISYCTWNRNYIQGCHPEPGDSRARDLHTAEKLDAVYRKTCASCSAGLPRI